MRPLKLRLVVLTHTSPLPISPGPCPAQEAQLGGRIAEEIIFGDITTGASQDIKQATQIARSMVTKYGMSEKLGPIDYSPSDSDEVFIGRDWGQAKNYSESTAAAIDAEVKEIMERCYKEAKEIIVSHKDVLESCAQLLLEKERVMRDEFEALFAKPAADPVIEL